MKTASRKPKNTAKPEDSPSLAVETPVDDEESESTEQDTGYDTGPGTESGTETDGETEEIASLTLDDGSGLAVDLDEDLEWGESDALPDLDLDSGDPSDVYPTKRAPIAMPRPRGRPKKNLDDIPTPRPHVKMHGTDRPNSTRGTVFDFFNYWNSLTDIPIRPGDEDGPRFITRIRGYLYRHWPVGGKYIKNRKGKVIRSTQIAKYFDTPLKDEMELLRHWGSGTYRILLNDSHSKSVIAECYIRNLHADEYPPVIPDMENWLDFEHKDNQSYIEGLRRSNQESEDDVSSTNLAARVGEKVLERVVDGAMSPPKPVVTPIVRRRHVTGPIRQQTNPMADMAAMMKVVKEMQPASPDPMATVTAVIQMAKALQPPTPASADTQLAESMREMGKTVTQALEQMSKIAMEKSAPTPVKTLREQIEEYKAMKELLEGDKEESGGAVEAAAKAGGLGDWINKDTMPLIVMGINTLGGIVANITAAITGRGAVVDQSQQQTAMAGAAGMGGILPAADNVVAMPGGNNNNNININPGGNPANPEVSQMSQMNQAMQFAATLADPILRCINEGKTGADFSVTFQEWHGSLVYNQIVNIGKENIIRLLASVPQLAAAMQSAPQVFEQFVDDFINPQFEDEGGEGTGESGGEGAAPAAAPGPKPVA